MLCPQKNLIHGIPNLTQENKNRTLAVMQRLEQALRSYGVEILSEFVSTSDIDQSEAEDLPSKSQASFLQTTTKVLADIHRVLSKQLSNSLEVILKQVFVDKDEQQVEKGVKCLMILYGLMKMQSTHSDNCNKLVRWIYDLSTMSEQANSMQMGSVISSIKSKLIKLGFIVFKKINGDEDVEISDWEDQQQFKKAVSHLIKLKEDKIYQLQYELCRVCETFVPMCSISAHLNQCEQQHQKQYYQNRIEQKGRQILEYINQMTQQTEEKYDLRIFLQRIFTVIGDRMVSFALHNQINEIKEVVDQYKHYDSQIYCQVIELLQNYAQIISKDSCSGDNKSDRGSKALIVSRRSSKKQHRISSITSLVAESQHIIVSQKTIITQSQVLIRNNTCKLSDFQMIRLIGKGSYSKVYLVRKKNTQDLYAMKIIQISDLNEDRLTAFKKQQKIYKSIKGGFNVKLYYSFCEDNLYFLILDYACGGNFRTLLQRETYLEEKDACNYLANLILAVDSIHQMGIVHRDLKPENIVINQLGQLILTDFNLSKLIKDTENDKPNTFFGTPDYIAPEVLRKQETKQTIDWFSVGVIGYEMVIGVTPFTDETPQRVFDNILRGQIEWPQIGYEQGQISPQCKNLLQGLLNADPCKRLGANGLAEIQNHSFFANINWSKISQLEYFYTPQFNPDDQQESLCLLQQIQNRKSIKININSIKFIPEQAVVRYDILKSITNKKMRFHRNSRFKLQKQLQALKILPSSQNISSRNNNSIKNFHTLLDSCSQVSRKNYTNQSIDRKIS